MQVDLANGSWPGGKLIYWVLI